MDGYFLIRHDRLGCRGGGVACYINRSLAVSLATSNQESIDAPEFLMLDICLPDNVHLLFAIVYRRPKGFLFNGFFDALSSFSHRFKHIICGDLNCNLLSNNFEACYLRDIVTSHSLHIVPSGATHHTATSDSWLDVFIIDDLERVISLDKSSASFIAGHDLLELSIQLNVDLALTRPMLRRNFRGIDVEALRDHINMAVGDHNHDITDVTELCLWINLNLTNALDIFAPSQLFIVKRSPVRWLTDDLRSRIKAKNRLFKNAKRSGSVLDYATYRLFRNGDSTKILSKLKITFIMIL